MNSEIPAHDAHTPDERLAALSSMDTQWRAFFEETPITCTVLDEKGIIIAANKRCAENFESPLGRPCHEVFLGRSEPCLGCPATETFKDHCAHDGAEERASSACRTMPAGDSARNGLGVIHFFQPETDADRLQKELLAYDCQFGAAAHGLKGCLTGMGGGVYMCDTGTRMDKPERIEKGFATIRRNFRRMQSIAHNVLYYLRDRQFYPEPLDAMEILKNVAEDHADEAEFMNTRIAMSGDLPAEVAMDVDRKALEAALINLICTSLDNCRGDSRDIDHEVHVSARVGENQMIVEMADNGAGLTAEELAEVTALFVDPRGLTPPTVGIYVVNKLAGLLGGSLDIESEKGRGTTYRLRVPYHG